MHFPTKSVKILMHIKQLLPVAPTITCKIPVISMSMVCQGQRHLLVHFCTD